MTSKDISFSKTKWIYLLSGVLPLVATILAPMNKAVAEEAGSIGEQLRSSMIWTAEQPAPPRWLFAGFRRDFALPEVPAEAKLQLFAYTRYQLFVNGEYVGRGPNRFENRRPEFDEWKLKSRLRKGRNVIAVLVRRDYSPALSSDFSIHGFSRIELHEPGMAARLELRAADGRMTVIASDSRWAGFSEPVCVDPRGFQIAL